jgi:predicted nuclease with TOPRIM domain
VDCQASIKTLKPINKNNDSSEERAEQIRIENELVNDYHLKMSAEEYESSPRVEELTTKLESLTDKIIQERPSTHVLLGYYFWSW